MARLAWDTAPSVEIMLASMTFSFQGLPRPPYQRGELAYQWVLGAIAQVDPAMASRLHDGSVDSIGSRYKPLTVSCVTRDETSTGDSRSSVIRATALNKDVGQVLRRVADRTQFAPLGDNPDVPVNVTFESGDASEPFSYAGIVAASAAVASDGARATLRFASPTAFAAGGNTVSLFPEPALVFGSLARRWNHHAGPALAFGEDLLLQLPRALRVESHALRTSVVFAAGRSCKGFVGECEYSVRRGFEPDVVRAFRSLLTFAYFSGVGMRTVMGMGQAREVNR